MAKITTNNEHFSVENVDPSYPLTICTCRGSDLSLITVNVYFFLTKGALYSSVTFTEDFDLKKPKYLVY